MWSDSNGLALLLWRLEDSSHHDILVQKGGGAGGAGSKVRHSGIGYSATRKARAADALHYTSV